MSDSQDVLTAEERREVDRWRGIVMDGPLVKIIDRLRAELARVTAERNAQMAVLGDARAGLAKAFVRCGCSGNFTCTPCLARASVDAALKRNFPSSENADGRENSALSAPQPQPAGEDEDALTDTDLSNLACVVDYAPECVPDEVLADIARKIAVRFHGRYEALRAQTSGVAAMWGQVPAEESDAEFLAALKEQQRVDVEAVVELLQDLRDDSPCRLDHHGYCQEHGWLNAGECPQKRIATILDRAQEQP